MDLLLSSGGHAAEGGDEAFEMHIMHSAAEKSRIHQTNIVSLGINVQDMITQQL
jgi:hypothetical protein